MVADKIFDEAKDFLPILGIDYIEFYVGNAKQSAYFYKSAIQSEVLMDLKQEIILKWLGLF